MSACLCALFSHFLPILLLCVLCPERLFDLSASLQFCVPSTLFVADVVFVAVREVSTLRMGTTGMLQHVIAG